MDEVNQPIPEGLQRGKYCRRKSIQRLDQIIKFGGAVGEDYAAFNLSDEKSSTKALLSRDNLRLDELDVETKADSATYSYYGKLINKECKEKNIPTPYPGAIGWAFRYTKDRVRTVNTLIYLLARHRTSEQFILNMKDVINVLHGRVNQGADKIKKLTEKIDSMNPEREIKRKTDAFNARMLLFKQREEALQKQIDSLKRKETQMQIEMKKLSKDLAITKKGKTDLERKYQVILNQKRAQETEYNNIQQRLISKLNQDISTSNLDIRQIGEIALLSTGRKKLEWKSKNPRKAARDLLEEFNEEQNQNHILDLQKVIAENEVISRQRDYLIERLEDTESELSTSISTVQPKYRNQDWTAHEGPSVFDFYYAKIREIFLKNVPEAENDVTMLLQSFPNKEHLVYTKVCRKFGITPVPKYTGVMDRKTRSRLGEINPLKRLSLNSISIPKDTFEKKHDEQPFNIRFYKESPAWVDENDLDCLSVELDQGWGFAAGDYDRDGDYNLERQSQASVLHYAN